MNNKVLEDLAIRCSLACKKENWSRDWPEAGCYLHLEASEFIEALRGEGDPVDEAGDVLFVLISSAQAHGIGVKQIVEASKQRHEGIMSSTLHLEASKYIEALRGKQKDPTEKAGRVLFFLLTLGWGQSIQFEQMVEALSKKLDKIEANW